MAKFFALRGPDEITSTLLHAELDNWLQDPYTFWVRPGSRSPMSEVPLVEIVKSFIQTERDDA